MQVRAGQQLGDGLGGAAEVVCQSATRTELEGAGQAARHDVGKHHQGKHSEKPVGGKRDQSAKERTREA